MSTQDLPAPAAQNCEEQQIWGQTGLGVNSSTASSQQLGCPRPSYFTSLNFSMFICEMETVIRPAHGSYVGLM